MFFILCICFTIITFLLDWFWNLEISQAKELRAYLKSKGAKISDDGPEDFVSDLKELIENCSVTWQSSDANESGIYSTIYLFQMHI